MLCRISNIKVVNKYLVEQSCNVLYSFISSFWCRRMGLHEIWIKWENKEVFKHGKVGRSFTSRSVHHTTTTNQYLLLSLWTHYQAVQLNNECFESLKVKSLISHVDISLINVYILCIDYPSTQYSTARLRVTYLNS